VKENNARCVHSPVQGERVNRYSYECVGLEIDGDSRSVRAVMLGTSWTTLVRRKWEAAKRRVGT